MSKTLEAVIPRNYEADKRAGYMCHFEPKDPFPQSVKDQEKRANLSTGTFNGPEDAFVLLGHPFQGNPNKDTRHDARTGKQIPVEPYIDQACISTEMGGVKVKWLFWDDEIGCNVYERVTA